MPRSKTKYPELNEIREDLDSLKDNVIALTKHVKKDGVAQVEDAAETAMTKLNKTQNVMQKRGQKQLEKLEKQVKAKPVESIAVAFAGGVIANMLLRGRR